MNPSTFALTRPVLWAGMLYLALPSVFFAEGWLQAAFSIPLCLGIAYGLYSIGRRLPATRTSLSVKQLIGLGLLTLGCLLLVFLCGFSGHIQQQGDLAVRNAIYTELIAQPWPLVLPNGKEFIYYLGHWLPPALVSSALPPSFSSWILSFWTFLGLELAMLTAACHWGVRTTLFWALVLMGMGAFSTALCNPGGWTGYSLLHAMIPGYNEQLTLFINFPSQIFATFNHAVPALLCTVMVLTRSLPPTAYYLMGAFLLLCSPLAGLALLPYMIAETVFRNKFDVKAAGLRVVNLLKSPVIWTAFLLVLITGVFYSHLDGGSQITHLFSSNYAFLYHYELGHMELYPDSVKYSSFLASLSLNILLPGLLLFPSCRRNPLYYITLAVMTASLFFRMGIMNNELLFKAPAVCYPVLAFLFIQAIQQSRNIFRGVLIIYLILASLSSLAGIEGKLSSFSHTPEGRKANRREEYGGSLDHPESPFYRQFLKKDGYSLPRLFFRIPD